MHVSEQLRQSKIEAAAFVEDCRLAELGTLISDASQALESLRTVSRALDAKQSTMTPLPDFILSAQRDYRVALTEEVHFHQEVLSIAQAKMKALDKERRKG